ncbi:flippase [Rhodococcus koreensis]|uniref:flippase n=1 Tax=Rhodococcus koreensis TaxID=99653 RepID=UPI00197CC5A9|nr:flippase [Rhodococcus koreensis]QSE87079.1 flippase [Rhodococcus koreensis]
MPAERHGDPVATLDTVAVSRRSLSLRSMAQLLMRILGAALGVGVAAVLARGLSTEEFGTLSLALTLASTGVALTDLGITQIAVREMARTPEVRAEIAAGLILGRSVLGVLAMIAMTGIGVLITDGTSARIAVMIVLSTLALTGLGSASAIAQSRLRPDVASAVVLVQNVVWLGLAALLALTNATLVEFSIAFVVSNIVQAVIFAVVTRRLVTVDWSNAVASAISMARAGLPFGVAALCVTAYYRFNGMILYSSRGATEAAYFSAAFRFIDALQIIPATVGFVLTPLLAVRSRDGRNSDAVTRGAAFATRILLLFVIPVVSIGSAVSATVVDVIYGETFVPTGAVLPILLVSFVFISLGYIVNSLVVSCGEFRIYLAIVAAIAVLNVLANWVAIPRFGAVGAAWTAVATEVALVVSVYLALYIRRNLSAPIGVFARFAAAGAVTYAVATVTNGLYGPYAAFALGAIAYCVLVIALRLVARADVTTIVSTKHEADV